MALPREVSLVLDRFNDARAARSQYEEKWLRAYRLYRSYKKPLPKEDEDLSNIFVPKTFSDIESITPRIVMATIARRPWVEIKPRAQDDVQRAKLVSKIIQAQFDKQGMFQKLVTFYKQALLYGTSPGKIFWRYEARRQRVRRFADRIVAGVNLTKLMGFSQRTWEEWEEVVEYDDPWFEPIDIFNFFPDPDGKTIEEMGWIIEREWVSREDMERAGVYDNIPEAVRTTKDPSQSRPDEERLAQIGLGGTRMSSPRTRPILLLHMWTNDRVITVANGSVVVRDQRGDDYPFHHGRKPFVAIVDTPVPNEFWGIGTVEAIADLQEELNSWRNLRMDNAKLAVHRMFAASRFANINPRDLRWRPGGVIWVDDLQDVSKVIKVIDVPDITHSAYLEDERLNRDIEETNAVGDFVRGSLTPTQRTATEIQQMVMGTSARVDLKVRLIAEMGLKEIARHFLMLNRQFLVEERAVRYIGNNRREEWITVTPGDLQVPFDDLIPAASNVESWANQIETRHDILRFLQILGRAPILAQNINLSLLMQRLLETFPFAEVEEFMIVPPEQQALIQRMLMAEAALPGGNGQPGDLMAAVQDGIRGQEEQQP